MREVLIEAQGAYNNYRISQKCLYMYIYNSRSHKEQVDLIDIQDVACTQTLGCISIHYTFLYITLKSRCMMYTAPLSNNFY